MEYILASQSPRRKEILEQLGLEFTIISPNCEEICHYKLPAEIVKYISLQKAKAIMMEIDETNDRTIISADTIVALNNEIFGKPKNKDEAFNMLSKLQNNWHQVYTGVTLTINGKIINYFEKADVHMIKLNDNQIINYIKTGEPMDKAGSYAIQGLAGKFIDKINGEYNTIVGLPTKKLKEILNL